jgi:Bacterial toxin 35
LAAAGGLAALVEFGYGNAVAEALRVSKGDFAITFAITALSCPNCTKEQFIESFAVNLAGNQIFKGIFVGLSDAQLLPKARLYAAAYIESLQERAFFNKIVAQIAEFGSKVNPYWQPFLDKVKTLVLNGSVISKGGKFISKEINDVVERVFSNTNKLNHLIDGSTNSVHSWETIVPNKNAADILDIVKETLQHGTDELYNGTLTKVAKVTRNGITKKVQITYININGKLIPSNGWVIKP